MKRRLWLRALSRTFRAPVLPRVGLTAIIVATVLSGCSSGSRGAAPPPTTSVPSRGSATPSTLGTTVRPAGSAPTTRARLPAAITAPPTTGTLPPLPTPAPIATLVSPPLPGEGAWQPVRGARLGRGYGIFTTRLRPAPGSSPAGVAWIDSTATRLALYAGSREPYGTWAQQGAIAAAVTPDLLAAFNAGFKIYAYRTGWYEQGRSAMPLQPGAASLVIFNNGTATVADWGRDVSSGPRVVAVRQNLSLLVDGGVAASNASDPSQWGAVLGGGEITWRSGLGVTRAGDLVYVGGADLDPAALARLLIAAGAVRAMELDINPDWVSFSTFAHAGGIAGTDLTAASNLLAGMYFQPGHYLQPFSRDFFAVFAR